MPSKTSTSSKVEWFSKAMFLQTTNTFLPIPIIYFIMLFLALPMDIFLWEIDLEIMTDVYKDLAKYANDGLRYGLGTAFLLGVLNAMLMYRHLCNNRSANMIHSLPIRREALFITQYLSGLSFVIVPNLMILALTLIALSFHGIYYALPFLYLFCIHCGLYFFFYNFAVICAMFTGSLGGTTIFYLIFNFVVAFVTLLIQPLFEIFYLGYDGSTFDYPFVQLLTPIYSLVFAATVKISYVTTTKDVNAPGGYFNLLPENIFYTMNDLDLFYGYTAVAVLFAVVSLFIYKYRHIELAGEAVAVPPLKPVFRFFMAVIGGLAMGIVSTFLVIETQEDPIARTLLPIASVFWGFVFTFVAEMIMQKSFRVLKYWKQSAFPLVAVIGIFSCLVFDLTGFEDYVPSYGEVESVTIQGVSGYPKDSASSLGDLGSGSGKMTTEEFMAVTELHQAGLSEYRDYLYHYEGVDRYQPFYVEYLLDTGYKVVRNYPVVPLERKDLKNPNSYVSLLQEILNDEGRKDNVYQLKEMQENGADVSFAYFYDEETDSLTADKSLRELMPDLSLRDITEIQEALADAILLDYQQGNVGKKFVFPDETEFVEDGMPLKITFQWEVTEENSIMNLSNSTVEEESSTKSSRSSHSKKLGDATSGGEKKSVTVGLTQSAVHTLAVLEEYEVVEEGKIITNQEHLELCVEWYQQYVGLEGLAISRKISGYYDDTLVDVTDPMTFVYELK